MRVPVKRKFLQPLYSMFTFDQSTMQHQAQRQDSVTREGINKFWGTRKLYFFEFESVDQKKKMFNAKFDEIWGKAKTKKGFHLKKFANFHKF